jgi:hypothetical protein
MREITLGQSSSQLLKYRGYKVYRGHTPYHTLSPQALAAATGSLSPSLSDVASQVQAFQTWGLSTRFAVVPTQEGLAWFAAVSCTNRPRFYWQDRDREGPLNQILNFPLKEDREMQILREIFQDWHQPIPELLASTDSTQVVCSYALSSKDVSGKNIDFEQLQILIYLYVSR